MWRYFWEINQLNMNSLSNKNAAECSQQLIAPHQTCGKVIKSIFQLMKIE